MTTWLMVFCICMHWIYDKICHLKMYPCGFDVRLLRRIRSINPKTVFTWVVCCCCCRLLLFLFFRLIVAYLQWMHFLISISLLLLIHLSQMRANDKVVNGFMNKKTHVLYSHHLYRMLNRTIFALNSINGATISRTMFLCVFVVIIISIVVVVVVVYYSLSIFHSLFINCSLPLYISMLLFTSNKRSFCLFCSLEI